ncbi:hypothetical protein TcWFU_004790 [Taenia crassiceps]|uniref:Matrix-remodeling-associated protein 7 helical domain-containing protein n=1 Tax=Taenia crassiceps TaxID=6207 RepID=A0ABR4QAY9_9CEST
MLPNSLNKSKTYGLLGQSTVWPSKQLMAAMESLRPEPSIVIYSFITIFVAIFGVVASRYLLKRKATNLGTLQQSDRITSDQNRKMARLVPSKTKQLKRVELLSHLPSRVKRLHEVQQLAELSAKEREAEMRARCDQLAAILEVMRQQPEHFGQVSQADLSAQMSDFYSATTAAVAPSIA